MENYLHRIKLSIILKGAVMHRSVGLRGSADLLIVLNNPDILKI